MVRFQSSSQLFHLPIADGAYQTLSVKKNDHSMSSVPRVSFLNEVDMTKPSVNLRNISSSSPYPTKQVRLRLLIHQEGLKSHSEINFHVSHNTK